MKIILSLLISLVCAGGLLAEKRSYRAPQPIGKFVPQMIDKMAEAGFDFTVREVYNEVKDGKQGFVIILKPKMSLCEITFFDEKGKTSLVNLMAQDNNDAKHFHRFFLERLNMKEIGVTPLDDNVPSGWPSPGSK